MIVRLLTLFLAALFMFAPVPAQTSEPQRDPAVVYANAQRGGDIGYTEGWFGSGDTRLHYVAAGEGPLVIFYHGFPSNWLSWLDVMEALKSDYRVVAVDGLGAGLSQKPTSLAPYRIDRLAKQLDRLARHLDGNRRFILVGHDWGAALSLAYAQAFPKRLHAVVGMSAPPYNLFIDLARGDAEQQLRSAYMQRFRTMTLDDVRTSGMAPRFAAQVYRGLRDNGDLSAEAAALFEASVGQPDAMNGGMNWYRANLSAFGDLSEKRFWPRHNRPIRVPTLIIWGDDDTTFLSKFLGDMPRYAPALSIIRLPGVGHMTPIEKAARAPEHVAAFLARLCGKVNEKRC